MRTFYKLPDNDIDPWRFSTHERVLPRILSSPDARQAANTYIYRQPFGEKMILTKILHDWNRDAFSDQPASTVIRPEAVPIIKQWLHQAKDYEVSVARRLFKHLQDHQDAKSGSKKRPGTSAGEYHRGDRDAVRPLSYQPQTSRFPFTNRSSLFNTVNPGAMIVNNQQASPHSSADPIPASPAGSSNNSERNTSAASRPSTQGSQAEDDSPPLPPSKPSTADSNKSSNNMKPSTAGSRKSSNNNIPRFPTPKSSAGRPATSFGRLNPPVTNTSSFFQTLSGPRQAPPPKTKQNYNGTTNSDYMKEMMERQNSAKKRLQFSAHMRNQPIEEPQREDESPKASPTPPQASSRSSSASSREERLTIKKKPSVTFFGEDEAHRDIGLNRHCPGRYYYPSQIVF